MSEELITSVRSVLDGYRDDVLTDGLAEAAEVAELSVDDGRVSTRVRLAFPAAIYGRKLGAALTVRLACSSSGASYPSTCRTFR